MPQRARPSLSELENRAMQVIWSCPEVTADQVRSKLAEHQVIKDSTVRTILRRLEAKGYVSHRTEGRTFVYQPVDGSSFVAAEAVRGIIDKFCRGSVESLLVGMVDRDIISPDKLRTLAERIAAARLKNAKPSDKPITRRKRT